MNIAEQQALRAKVPGIVLEWAERRDPPFTGEGREGFDEAILVAHLVADEGRVTLHRWVEAARRSGLSWSEIGDVLGISKQAAQQRFRMGGAAEGEQHAQADEAAGETVVRYGAHAFNEMSILREEGRKGHELISVGPLYLTFRRTDVIWQYRRRIGSGLEREGWTHVASWLPFHYFKRPAE